MGWTLVARELVAFAKGTFAARRAVPAIYEWREFAIAGGLISYGSSLAATYRQAGVYAGKILQRCQADRSAGPADTFELVIKSEDCQRPRPRHTALDPRPRRRGHRMRRLRCLQGSAHLYSTPAPSRHTAPTLHFPPISV